MKAKFLGTKTTEFEGNKICKVYLGKSTTNSNVYGMDVLVANVPYESLNQYHQLQAEQVYDFDIDIESGSQNKAKMILTGVQAKHPAKS